LMDKERGVRAYITKAVIFESRSLPGIPGFYRQRVRSRSKAEKVHHHVLAVIVPSIGQETDFGGPSMRQQRRVFREPSPVNALEDLIGKAGNFGASEVCAAGKYSTEPNGGVDGRVLRVPRSFAGVQVSPVIVEPAVCLHLFRQEAQR